jgi:hypothetical protein
MREVSGTRGRRAYNDWGITGKSSDLNVLISYESVEFSAG